MSSSSENSCLIKIPGVAFRAAAVASRVRLIVPETFVLSGFEGVLLVEVLIADVVARASSSRARRKTTRVVVEFPE